MELNSEGAISGLFKSLGRFNEDLIRVYAKQVLEGLTFLHSKKIVHGDLKCANCLNQSGVVQISDFGCSRLISETDSNMTNSIKGTVPWMAPEVLKSDKPKFSADIWSYGCLIIEMFVGGNPWGGELG